MPKEIDEMTLQKEFSFYVPFDVKKSKEGELSLFGGIASSSSIDRDNDKIEAKALHKMAEDLMKNPTVFFNHDHKGLAVGKVVNAEVRGEDNLWVDVQPSKAAGVKDVITQINEGILRGLSIGGKVKEADTEYDKSLGKDVRTVKEVELYEVSVVGIPANADASIMSSITKAWGDSVAEKSKKETEKAGTDVEKEHGRVAPAATGKDKETGSKPEGSAPKDAKKKETKPETKPEAKKPEAKPEAKSEAKSEPAAEGTSDASKSVSNEDIKKVLEHPDLKKVVSAFVSEDMKKAFEEKDLELKAMKERLDKMQKEAYGPKRRGEVTKSGDFKEDPEEDKSTDKKTNVEFPSLLRASKGI